MKNMKDLTVLGFYGHSNSGKTKLIEKLTKKITKKGIKVATIKNTNKKISIDTKKKDTWKHSQAGSNIVVLSTPIETGIIIKNKIKNIDIINIIQKFQDFDIILIEGANDPDIQKIRLNKNIKKRKNTILTYNNNFDELFKIILEKIKH
jgi:molybdopterin-guanine dinucleotide biosynthesis protein MobB